MKILHTADWHLGKRLNEYARLEEQQEVLEEIYQIAEKEAVDVVLIAGDLFDTYNPPSEAVELFYKTVCRLSAGGQRAVIAIAGNHDSPDRIEAPDPMARACGIIFCGSPVTCISPFNLDSGLTVLKSEPGFIEVMVPNISYPLRLLLTPYANEQSLKKFLGTEDKEEELRTVLRNKWEELASRHCDEKGVNILLAHLFFMERGGPAPEEPDDEKPILHMGGAQAIYTDSIPSHIQYAALGHLHRYQWISKQPCPVVYSSSPLSYSFSEANQSKFVMLIEAEPGKKINLKALQLSAGKKLVRKRFEAVEDALTWLNDNQDTYVELTLKSDTYIEAKTKKALFNAHPRIVTIIPEFTGALKGGDTVPLVEVTDIKKAFKDYFKARKGQEPDRALMEIFSEIIEVTDETD